MKVIPLLYFVLMGFFAFAQSDNIQQLLDKGYHLEPIHPDSAILMYKQAALLSKQAADNTNLAKSLHYQGIVFSDQGRYDSAKVYYKKAIHYFELSKDTLGIAKVNNNLANVAQFQADYETAVTYYLAAIKGFEQADEKRLENILKNNLSSVFHYLNMIDKAMAYGKEVLEFGKINKDSSLMMDAHNNLSAYYLAEKDTVMALQHAEAGFNIAKKINNLFGLTVATPHLTTIYTRSNPQKALGYALEAKTYAEQLQQPRYICAAYAGLAAVQGQLKQNKEAIQNWEKAIQMAKDLKQPFDVARYMKHLIALYEKQGNITAAHSYYATYSRMKDTIFDLEKNKAIAELETQYQVAQKEEALKNQTLLTRQERQTRQAWTVAAALLGLLLLFSVFFFRQRIKQNKLLNARERDLQQSRIQQLEQEQKVLTLNAMISGQEEERQRIAKDLHDSLGSLLSTVKLNFKAIQQRIKAIEPLNLYNRVNELLDDASKEVRRISHDMMPDVLKISLAEGLREIAEKLQQSNQLAVSFQEIGSPKVLNDTQKVMLYRVVQELTQNVVKHAQAQHLLLQLIWQANSLQIVVEDNGKGFQMSQVAKGLGLKSIQSRMEYLKGEVDFDSELGAGTTVTLNLELNKAQ